MLKFLMVFMLQKVFIVCNEALEKSYQNKGCCCCVIFNDNVLCSLITKT